MTTFTALGDSITLGLGDPTPGGEWRGWAVFLAGGPARRAAAQPGHHRGPGGRRGAQPAAARAGAAPRRGERGGRHQRRPAARLRPGARRRRAGPRDRLAERGGRRGADHAAPRPGADARHARRAGPAAGPAHLRAEPDHGPAGGAVRHAALRRGRGQPGVRPLHVERGPAAPQRARAPAHRLPFPRPVRRARPPGRAPPGHRADQPGAHPPRRVHLDGDQGYEVGAAPVHGPAALPGGDGGAGLLPDAAAGASGTGTGGGPRARWRGP